MTDASSRVRVAAAADAQEAARLLHDFNTEFDAFTPGVEALAPKVARLIEMGAATILLGGDGPDGVCVLRFREALFEDGLAAYLEELYVAPAKRGQGLGRAILETAMQEARNAGAVRIELGTSEVDVAARALYESAGFTNLEDGEPGATMYVYEREL
jgi:GNAT superfamily N-acetyltransferase